ncbi:asparaginase [Myceligenerans pegani]|uniref:Asparaginase n=1 Tax=Myceligenerans pegani TaxID=2776917 RepID=A0ABR9MUT6_9MICO|nr:asparaginase [Myceligenerans sp. TRM 65318]MBE1875130.1 asparaginase [Myceligenerans sp. TRM 65318]MBE3017401.1 asparaginase [Myceligenerans sp. TRM 65318]
MVTRSQVAPSSDTKIGTHGPTVADAAAPLAHVLRGGLVESVHLGHLVVLGPDGAVRLAVGDPDVVIWPRSSAKPVQALAMLEHGLDLPDPLLALVAASHNGEPFHRAGVREILGRAGLTPGDLRNTPDMPLHAPSAFAWQMADHVEEGDGPGPAPIAQNCSGKHAGMLATCVAAGWSREGYLEIDHPLQVAVRERLAALTGVEPARVTVDGCGAPLFSTTLSGLARAFGRIAAAPDGPEARVARAMNAHPEMVGGDGREATLAMRAVPGLVAKDGADGVYGAGLPDGSAVAFKVLDGGPRPRPAILAAALRAAGAADVPGADPAALDSIGDVPVLGGGRPVGRVSVPFA